MCHDTLHDLEFKGWCVRVRFLEHKQLTRVFLFIPACEWSYVFLHYFTFEISVCVSVRVCACAVFAHSEHPPLCFNNLSEYILCLLTCVTQPLSTGNSKSSEVVPLTICTTCQLSVQCYHVTQCLKGWLEILSDSPSKTSVKFRNQHLSHEHYGNKGKIWCKMFSGWNVLVSNFKAF